MTLQPTVFVVDDNSVTCGIIERLVQSLGLNVESYASAEGFLDAIDAERPGCLVLDVQLPGMNGLELQKELAARGIRIPVIFISGIVDVPTALRAMKANALDFLVKPFSSEVLLGCIQEAIQRDAQDRLNQAPYHAVRTILSRLTSREREVMDLVVQGKPNKQIATQLGLSEKTVETHRAKLMRKVGAENVADLVRIAMLSDQVQREPS
ncbi:MAG: response regulator transcription factor [Planctomycetes bacterium]|nr:response regulator transcription factor [Planctomycetota bacterium]